MKKLIAHGEQIAAGRAQQLRQQLSEQIAPQLPNDATVAVEEHGVVVRGRYLGDLLAADGAIRDIGLWLRGLR